MRNGIFEADKKIKGFFQRIAACKGHDASFFDFDNDGYLDLIIAGESTEKDGQGIIPVS